MADPTGDLCAILSCEPPAETEVRLSQLPLEVAYAYEALRPFVVGEGLLWKTPPPS